MAFTERPVGLTELVVRLTGSAPGLFRDPIGDGMHLLDRENRNTLRTVSLAPEPSVENIRSGRTT